MLLRVELDQTLIIGE